MDTITITKIINSTGLCFDALGAWFVAWEVVKQFKGQKYHDQPTWVKMAAGPEATDEYKSHEKDKYIKMKIGLFLLMSGFALQLLSNWPNLLCL